MRVIEIYTRNSVEKEFELSVILGVPNGTDGDVFVIDADLNKVEASEIPEDEYVTFKSNVLMSVTGMANEQKYKL